jgi:hypothetical protein
MTNFLKRITRKQWTIGLGVLIVLLGTFMVFRLNTNQPNLGTRLEYIGKINTTCEWWQVPLFFGTCKGPDYDYYFATDMSEEDIKGYFSKASYINTSAGINDYDSLDFRSDYGYFVVNYYNDSSKVYAQTKSLQQSPKPHVVKLGSAGFTIVEKVR